ncbi:MAG: alpha/beta hydrolase [Halioglobus sp.]
MYFIAGILAVLLPLLAFVAVKKSGLLETRPDDTIEYKRANGQPLSLHAFFADKSNADETKPALILFHGGRWLYGHPRAFYPQCQFFAAQGYHCFSAQYRLGRNNRVDVQALVADAQDALDYVAKNAQSLNVNAEKISVGGGSAGGHLAAALGTVTLDDSSARPASMVLFNPMLDLAPATPDHYLVKDYWQTVSPHHNVKAGIPPALILVGSNDPEVPVPTAQAFCTAAEAAGGRCELEVYEGQSHGFFNAQPFLDKTNERVLRFLMSL